ncbi:hypothetical protein E2C01_097839 [Portunus trituberculatus]|uniref:Uncharacterized protein n=1 Tax=Portunus trituberculatus TaxID=210409 RepID=A0A5B7K5W5_PORTR|nr:hypothetical protein [Portunus trituberculatus]
MSVMSGGGIEEGKTMGVKAKRGCISSPLPLLRVSEILHLLSPSSSGESSYLKDFSDPPFRAHFTVIPPAIPIQCEAEGVGIGGGGGG